MPFVPAAPRSPRSSRSGTAESSCPAGTTWLSRPQSSAVRASMTSPDMASSMARLRPTLRATATIGVWQNQPPLPPGVANAASSLATARSALATSWPPPAVAQPVDLGHHRLGDLLHECHQLGAGLQQRADLTQVRLGHVGEVVPGAEHRT